MRLLKELQISKFIALKLEEEVRSEEEGLSDFHTNIYVCGELFQQCSFLLINIPVEKITSLDTIESIDEAEERLDTSLEEDNYIIKENGSLEYRIPPETEFWGHCSNIQTWVENDYNTQIIHRYLAFPLLKRLTEVGDQVARRVFKEEIAKRFTSCYLPVVHLLLFEDYLQFLSENELEILFNEIKSRNELLFLYIEPILMIKGLIKHELSDEEFNDYLDKFDADEEAGKYVKLNKYENFDMAHHNVALRWVKENIEK